MKSVISKNAWFILSAIFFLSTIILCFTGCTAEQRAAAQKDIGSIQAATTNPVVVDVAGVVPYGTAALKVLSTLLGFATLAIGWLQKTKGDTQQKLTTANTALVEVGTAVKPDGFHDNTGSFSPATTEKVDSLLGPGNAVTAVPKTSDQPK